MTSIEIFILLMVLGVAIVGIGYAYLVKQQRQAEADRRAAIEADRWAKIAKLKERERQLDAEREKLRQHPNYWNPRFNPLNPDVLMPEYKTGPVSDTASMIAARKRVGNVPTSQKQYVSSNSVGIQSQNTVVYDNTADEMITSLVLSQIMNRDNDTPRETYRAPEPERSTYTSSYTSSSDDDSSKRSSYTSSYSSDTSDSNYSSSSSDSSSSWD